MDLLRRNPKRKAAEVVSNATSLSDDLLEAACYPLTSQEIEEWEGWVELESEPAFFNIILRDLGVKDVKTQELFTVDQDSLCALSQPVFGLIFLFQYEPGHEEAEKDTLTNNQIWFANQTTNNACATIALLNIIMNAENIDLGERLEAFKKSTSHLSTALRGHRVSSDSSIRAIHNSFTRRMDHLNADLGLENDVSDAKSKKKKNTWRGSQKRSKKGRRRPTMEYGFHFVAYIPSDGRVWELDGLRDKPQDLGLLDSQDWTTIARPHIEARMLRYEESQLSFNLLAVCRSPLSHHSQSIATMVAAVNAICERMADNSSFNELTSADDLLLDVHDQRQLTEYNLSRENIQKAKLPPRLELALARPPLGVDEAYELYEKYSAEAGAAMAQFRDELISMEEDGKKVKGRKRDYGSALHCWVKKLAEKGVLEDLIKMSAGQ